jgi:hypothetical protein
VDGGDGLDHVVSDLLELTGVGGIQAEAGGGAACPGREGTRVASENLCIEDAGRKVAAGDAGVIVIAVPK